MLRRENQIRILYDRPHLEAPIVLRTSRPSTFVEVLLNQAKRDFERTRSPFGRCSHY